jgi:hypothetical protein
MGCEDNKRALVTRFGAGLLVCFMALGATANAQQGSTSSIPELESAARAGNKEAQGELGFRLMQGTGVARDAKKAVEWLERAAAQGDPKAQRALGYAYATGSGVEKDFAKARSFYESAVAQGDLEALNNLGLMAMRGEGREASQADAESYFRRAIDKGYINSMLPLGLSLLGSAEKPGKDPQEGIAWIRRGARAGHSMAAFALFRVYANGFVGILKDDREAARWLTVAAQAGNADAQLNLSVAHRSGLYQLARDPREAYFWVSLASNQMHPAALIMRGELEQALTPTEIADVQQQLRNWKVKPAKDERQGLVALSAIKSQYKFDAVELSKENFGAVVKKCVPTYPQSAVDRFLSEWKIPFKNSTTSLGHTGSAGVLVIKESTAVCVRESEAGFPLWAGEAIEQSIEPDGMPASVREDWYTQIADVIARKGYADVVFQFSNGNGFVTTFKPVTQSMYLLEYRTAFRKAGEYDPSRYDRVFAHPELKTIKTSQYGSQNQKVILQHRFQATTSTGSGSPVITPVPGPSAAGHQL